MKCDHIFCGESLWSDERIGVFRNYAHFSLVSRRYKCLKVCSFGTIWWEKKRAKNQQQQHQQQRQQNQPIRARSISTREMRIWKEQLRFESTIYSYNTAATMTMTTKTRELAAIKCDRKHKSRGKRPRFFHSYFHSFSFCPMLAWYCAKCICVYNVDCARSVHFSMMISSWAF